VPQYLGSRLLSTFPVLLLISVFVFSIMHLLPGDPAMLILQGQSATTPEQVARLRADLGLNDPVYVQYGRFLLGALQGDLGRSVQFKRPVMAVILERLPRTAELTAAALVIAVAMGVTLGVVAGVRQNSWVDNLSIVLSVVGLTMPIFYIGLLLILLFSVKLMWFPVTTGSDLHRLILPGFTLGFVSSGIIARLVRANLLEVLRQDFITTARSKGLADRAILYRHAFRNMLIPVITVIGLQIGGLLSGSVITETVFNRPGLGRLAVEAILWKDFPLAQGTILFTATAYLMVNLVVDVSYAWLDPRIRYS
jgi:peptide/nickel transport system permease protein